jgi:hypothetical protein
MCSLFPSLNQMFAFPAGALILSSLYGRFMIASMDSTYSTIIVSLVLGLEEVLLRVSIRWRDRKLLALLSRIRCGRCSPNDRSSEFSESRAVVLYSDMASLDIVCENSSIVVSGVMVAAFAGMPPGRAIFSTVLQLLIEVVIDFVCVQVEINHGLRVVEAWNLRGHKSKAARRFTGFWTPHRRWSILVSVQIFITSVYVASEMFSPGYGLWAVQPAGAHTWD